MRKILTVFLASALLWSCVQDDEDLSLIDENVQPEQEIEIVPKSEIDAIIKNALEEKNEFNWSELNDVQLWSALVHSDSILTVGYLASGKQI